MVQDKGTRAKWWQYRKIGREEAGKTALVGLTGFVFLSLLGAQKGFLGGLFGLLFWIGGITWIVKTIKQSLGNKKIGEA